MCHVTFVWSDDSATSVAGVARLNAPSLQADPTQ